VGDLTGCYARAKDAVELTPQIVRLGPPERFFSVGCGIPENLNPDGIAAGRACRLFLTRVGVIRTLQRG